MVTFYDGAMHAWSGATFHHNRRVESGTMHTKATRPFCTVRGRSTRIDGRSIEPTPNWRVFGQLSHTLPSGQFKFISSLPSSALLSVPCVFATVCLHATNCCWHIWQNKYLHSRTSEWMEGEEREHASVSEIEEESGWGGWKAAKERRPMLQLGKLGCLSICDFGH